MASYWITAIASIAGAVVGAGTTLIANLISSHSQSRTQVMLAADQVRTQVMLAADERNKHIADVRRAACSEYLTAADSFYDQARELAARMHGGAEPAELKDAHDDYFEGWKLLQRVVAPVVIGGPPCLSEKADAFMLKLGDLANICDKWHDAHVRDPSTPSRGTKVENAQEASNKARDEFISVAQRNAFPDPDKPALVGDKPAITSQ